MAKVAKRQAPLGMAIQREGNKSNPTAIYCTPQPESFNRRNSLEELMKLLQSSPSLFTAMRVNLTPQHIRHNKPCVFSGACLGVRQREGDGCKTICKAKNHHVQPGPQL